MTLTQFSARPDTDSASHGDSCMQRIESSINRAIGVLDEETAALRAGGAIDMVEFSRRKGQCLVELSRLMGHSSELQQNIKFAAPLEELRRKSNENALLLKAHMQAIEEVVQIVHGAIESEASDGTYSRTF